MTELVDEIAVRLALKSAIERHGIRAVADNSNSAPVFLREMLDGSRDMWPSVARYLGFDRVVRFRPRVSEPVR